VTSLVVNAFVGFGAIAGFDVFVVVAYQQACLLPRFVFRDFSQMLLSFLSDTSNAHFRAQ
jgi:hypothetical protein